MKKLLLIALLMLALVITAVACTETPEEPGTSPEDVTTAETPTEAPTDEPSTPAPETDPETPAPETDPETPAPETEPETPAPETDEPETPEPETEPPVDPADPVWIVGAEQLNELANVAGASNTSAELKDGYISLTAKGGDPWFMVAGNIGEMPEYMVIRYRTNASQGGEFFIGNGTGPVGGESFLFNYNANGEWNLLIFHLPTVASYMATPTVGYIRYDFYTGGADEGFLDVEYIAFFNSAEYALAYDFEMNKAPMWDADKSVVAHQSFDQFFYGDGSQDDAAGADSPLNLYHAGTKPDWDFVADMVGSEYTCLTYWGWIATTADTIGQFGYQVGMNAPIFDDAWTHATEQGVLDAAAAMGGVTGSRMKIRIDTTDFEGETPVRVLYKDADGNVVCLNEVTVMAPVKPTHYDNYNVPQDLWTVTGHCPGIVGKEGHANSGMVAAGGVESGALIHQGAVALGEIDLSKYSKVVIMWGCDNSEVTVGHYNNSANNRIMLVSADVNGTAPAEDTIIAGGTYELGGWAVQAFEIDLTEVDYNGPVYLCIDTLPGTFALFASVEFIGAEIDYSHQHSYEAVVTAPTCTEAGFTTYTCSCGDTYVADEVAALGHDMVTDAAVDATCTEAGLTAGEHCSRCDHKVAQEEIPAKGHAYDENGICSACDDQIAVKPEVGKGYIFGMLQGNLNKVYYLKGGMDGYYMATTTDPAQAILVFIEETEGGYHFYTIQNGTKTYINMVVSGTHVNGQYASTATTVYTIDETSKTLVATVNGAPYWFGTRNDKTYTTMGPCKTSYNGFFGEFYFAHAHSFEVSETVEATCEGEGYTKYTCSCGDSYRENVVAALGHSFTEGTCTVCGAADPDYVAPEDPDQPAGPVIGSADFNTITVTNTSGGDSGYTKSYTTEAGWVTLNAAIQAGGATNMNPQYTVIGPDNTYKAVCLNGKVSAPGKLTSPTLNGGLTKLTLTYTKIFTDLKLGVTVTVTELSSGTVYTHVIERDVEKDTDKYVVWTDEWVLETPVVGDYTIEIVNNCPSGLDGNKDRMTILSIDWEGTAPEQGGEDIPHEHSYTAEVTAPTCTVPGFTTYTCACGDTYTADETEVVPHVDTDLDITCDFEGCTKRILPAADSEISLFTANKMIIVSLSSSYYMQGVVTEVTDAKNGVFVIRDEAGDTILVRLPKNAEGASHSTWEQKIVVGDTVRVYGQPKQNTGSTAGQKAKVEGGILTIVASHDHVFSEATCLDNGVCFCGKIGTPALGHADEDASGFCDRCDWNMNLKVETVVTRTDDGSAVVDEAKTSSVWTGTEFSVTVNKAGGSMLYTTAKDHMRFYKNNELVIASVNGKVMQTVTIVTTNATQMANMEKLLTGLTYTKDEAKFTLTIEYNSAEALTIANSGTSTIQFKAFEIVYE